MKRYIVLGSALLFVLIASVLFLFNKPAETEYRLARGRAQLYTENYLAALQTLRDLPDSQKGGPQAHSYLGAAYLKLHLYRAAIKEFEEARRGRMKRFPHPSREEITLGGVLQALGDPVRISIVQSLIAQECERPCKHF